MPKSFKFKLDFWTLVLLVSSGFIIYFVILPLSSLFTSAFINPQTGEFSLMHFERFATRRFIYNAFFRSLRVSTVTAICSLIIGAVMAYITTVYKVRGKGIVDILLIISMLSPPFIGAYSWILLAGRNGYLVQWLRPLGITPPDIYGFGGIILVMTLSSFPLIYLFTKGALKKVDASLLEAAEGLGCNPIKKAVTLSMPLITPTVLAASLLVFTDAFTDFGTPMLIGEGFQVLSVLIFNEFVGEMGRHPNFAAALSLIMIAVVAVLFIIQKYLIDKKSFTMSSLRPIVSKQLTGWRNSILHAFVYMITAFAIIPQMFIVISSFRNTYGPMWAPGFSFDNYIRVFERVGNTIRNTFVFAFIAIAIIILFALFLAYLTVRRRSWLTNILDYLATLPLVIPGSVIGIMLLMTFSTPPLVLIATPSIMILAFVIRRLPFTLRSSSGILYQISPSIEEAAISLGDTPMKSFLKITAVMMIPGVLSGAILSWITTINELNASILLFGVNTRTVTVSIYQSVMASDHGAASASATILIVATVISILLFFKLSGNKDMSL